MTTTLAAALTVRTEAEELQALLAALTSAGVDANGFGTYSVERALPSIDAAARALESSIRADVVKAGFIDLAAKLDDPAWCRALAKAFYQVDWIQATKARHTFRVTNLSSGGPYNIKARDLVASTTSGILFDVDGAATVLAGSGNYADVEFVCQTAGAIGNIGTGQIVKLQKTPFPGLSVTNLAGSLITAGREDETNAELVERCKTRWGTLGAGGNDGAMSYLAKQAAPTVTRVFVRTDNPFGAGSIGVTLANASGPATSDEVAAADAVLQPKKPNGSGKLVTAAAPAVVVSVTGVLTIDGSNSTASTDAATALAKLATQFSGAKLYLELVRSVCMGAAFAPLGLAGFTGVKNVVLSAPAADVTIPPGSVLQFTTSLTQVIA